MEKRPEITSHHIVCFQNFRTAEEVLVYARRTVNLDIHDSVARIVHFAAISRTSWMPIRLYTTDLGTLPKPDLPAVEHPIPPFSTSRNAKKCRTQSESVSFERP